MSGDDQNIGTIKKGEALSVPRPFAEAFTRMLYRKVPRDPHGRTFLDLIVEGLFLKAIRGDIKAFREIRQLVEGAETLEYDEPCHIEKRACCDENQPVTFLKDEVA